MSGSQRTSPTSYRTDATLRCPACVVPMQSQSIQDAVIDVCEECGGVWVDPEDGDVGTVATQAHVPEPSSDAALRPAITCPRCAGTLAAWTVDEVTLSRCAACSGIFIPHAAVDGAMWLTPEAGQPPLTGLGGLGGWVRRLLGRG